MSIEIVAFHYPEGVTKLTMARVSPLSMTLLCSAMQDKCASGVLKHFEIHYQDKKMTPKDFKMDSEDYPNWQYPYKWAEKFSVSGRT